MSTQQKVRTATVRAAVEEEDHLFQDGTKVRVLTGPVDMGLVGALLGAPVDFRIYLATVREDAQHIPGDSWDDEGLDLAVDEVYSEEPETLTQWVPEDALTFLDEVN